MTMNGDLTPLLSFDFTRGAGPQGGMILGNDGAFYGPTSAGGSGANGTVFRFTPDGNLLTLARFNGSNGDTPFARLTFGHDGALYGTTYYGGTGGRGEIYRIVLHNQLRTPTRTVQGWRFTSEGLPGITYRLQRATTLGGGWTDVGATTATPDGQLEFTDDLAPAGAAFYRTAFP